MVLWHVQEPGQSLRPVRGDTPDLWDHPAGRPPSSLWNFCKSPLHSQLQQVRVNISSASSLLNVIYFQLSTLGTVRNMAHQLLYCCTPLLSNGHAEPKFQPYSPSTHVSYTERHLKKRERSDNDCTLKNSELTLILLRLKESPTVYQQSGRKKPQTLSICANSDFSIQST